MLDEQWVALSSRVISDPLFERGRREGHESFDDVYSENEHPAAQKAVKLICGLVVAMRRARRISCEEY
jgi:hypothetical protein